MGPDLGLIYPRYQIFGRNEAPRWGFLLSGESWRQPALAGRKWAGGPFFVLEQSITVS